MKKTFGIRALPFAVAASMMFAACGSDDNSSNVERGEGSSSSVEETSSSSVEESSSSISRDVPEGARVATLDDLEKNMSLGQLFGTDVYLATGVKKGMFSIWIPDTAWIVVRSDFKDGVLEYGKSNGSFMGLKGIAIVESMNEFFNDGGKLDFIVNDKEQLQVSVNGGKYVDVNKTSVSYTDSWFYDAAKLKGIKLSCTAKDGKLDYTFFDGRYLLEETGAESSKWSAGYYDIHRSRLLMLPVFYDSPVYALSSGKLSSEFQLDFDTGDKAQCEKSSFEFEAIDHDSIAGEWVASKDGSDWVLKLKKSGDYSVEAKKSQTTVLKSGTWDVYGDMLFLRNLKCGEGNSCPRAVKGSVEGLDPKVGFTFNHNDEKAVPTVWTLPKYE